MKQYGDNKTTIHITENVVFYERPSTLMLIVI